MLSLLRAQVQSLWCGQNKTKANKQKIQPPCLQIIWFFGFLPFIYLFIYLWLRWVFVAACGLSLIALSGGYSSLAAVRGFLIAMASLVAEHEL